ncbi:hypothetical protein ANCCAN_23738 [Ancylostoma caninum]|uniref:Uncharacterized protein n=1 Tax=Ancylostoma caninum TaxID=29170 RepID=A0A368FI38_ANCCA|nr:hypothetical protein ANCCAN_23738 [Ancylostoma caninum]
MYPRFNQYPWRSAYASIPTGECSLRQCKRKWCDFLGGGSVEGFIKDPGKDSDIQFSYLMTHPQAAMTYQNLAYN